MIDPKSLRLPRLVHSAQGIGRAQEKKVHGGTIPGEPERLRKTS